MSNSDFFELFPEDETPSLDLMSDLDLSLQEMGLAIEASPDNLEAMLGELNLEDEATAELLTLGNNVTSTTDISLVPPLWQDHQTLRQQVDMLELALSTAEQKLAGQDRRSQSNDDLIQQQAEELKKTREQLAHTVAELTIYQQEAQRQQLQLETLAEQLAKAEQSNQTLTQDYQQLHQAQTAAPELTALTEQLATSQAQNQHLAREHQRLEQDYRIYQQQVITLEQQLEEVHARLNHQSTLPSPQVVTLEQQVAELQNQLQQTQSQTAQQVVSLEHQVQDLQNRLQRQQRYTLQYKSALEQCLAQPNFQPSSDMASAIAALTGRLSEIRPWSNSADSEVTQDISPVAPVTPSDSVLPLASENTATSETVQSPVEIPSPMVAQATTPEAVEVNHPPSESLPVQPKRERLSFAIQPKRTPRRNIDLPRFLPQTVSHA